MAKLVLNPITGSLDVVEPTRATVQNAEPTTAKGKIWLDTDEAITMLKVYDGSNWITVGGEGPQGPAGGEISWKGDWVLDTAYTADDAVSNDGSSYACILTHTSTADDEPGVGVDWETYWVLMASVGAQGPQGNQGSAGPQGTQGVQGAQGNQGNIGPQGNQGSQGNQGPQGHQGNQGSAGAQGNQGNQGVQGTQGNTGSQGPQGYQGNQGNQGNTGADSTVPGPQGPQGNQGATGTQGTQGVQGATGSQGPQGNQGASGAQGTQGVQGTTGSQGPQGHQGNQGSAGAQGNQGNQGVQGTQGAQGTQGSTGAQGTQGNQGDTGTKGPQGDTGAQGNQGNQGAPATLQDVYPVGCIYTTTVSTNPATVFGFGTWEAYGEGKVLVGKAAAGTFATAGATGGAETHTLSTTEMPSHKHNITYSTADGANGYFRLGNANNGTADYMVQATGGGGAHNNLQPYIVVYFFKRTA